jgi:hypothetical protein
MPSVQWKVCRKLSIARYEPFHCTRNLTQCKVSTFSGVERQSEEKRIVLGHDIGRQTDLAQFGNGALLPMYQFLALSPMAEHRNASALAPGLKGSDAISSLATGLGGYRSE